MGFLTLASPSSLQARRSFSRTARTVLFSAGVRTLFRRALSVPWAPKDWLPFHESHCALVADSTPVWSSWPVKASRNARRLL